MESLLNSETAFFEIFSSPIAYSAGFPSLSYVA